MNFTVVIPLYNKEAHIARAIDSVLSQTVDKFELVVIDDGSTDAGPGIVKRNKDRRLRYVRQENLGESAARNAGIDVASGELIAFLDADDAWAPDFLATILRLVGEYPFAGLYCTAYKVQDAPDVITYPEYLGIPPAPWEGIVPNYLYSATGPSPACSSACAVWKKVLLEVNGFPSGVKSGADLATWLAIAMRYPVAFSGYVGATYYRDAQNRVCAKRLVSDGYLDILRRNLSDSCLAKENSYYLRIMLEKELISLSSSCVLNGDSLSARRYLAEITGSAFRRVKLYWFLLSFLPKNLLTNLLKFKLKMLNPLVSRLIL